MKWRTHIRKVREFQPKRAQIGSERECKIKVFPALANYLKRRGLIEVHFQDISVKRELPELM
jgi:hypothetical protein